MKYYRQDILGYWPSTTPEERKFRQLAREYVQQTEAFDQIHCSSPIKPQERATCTKHALKLYSDLGMQARGLGFKTKDWHDAVAEAQRRERK